MQPAIWPSTSRLMETQYGLSAPSGNIYDWKAQNSHEHIECKLHLSPLKTKCTRFWNTQSVSKKIILPLWVTLLVSRVMTCDTEWENACFPTVRKGWIATSLCLSPPPHLFSSSLLVSLWVFWSVAMTLPIYLLASVSVAKPSPAHQTAFLQNSLSIFATKLWVDALYDYQVGHRAGISFKTWKEVAHCRHHSSAMYIAELIVKGQDWQPRLVYRERGWTPTSWYVELWVEHVYGRERER